MLFYDIQILDYLEASIYRTIYGILLELCTFLFFCIVIPHGTALNVTLKLTAPEWHRDIDFSERAYDNVILDRLFDCDNTDEQTISKRQRCIVFCVLQIFPRGLFPFIAFGNSY
jgi:hypothetical protein